MKVFLGILFVLLISGCVNKDLKYTSSEDSDVISLNDIPYDQRIDSCRNFCWGLYSHDSCANNCMAGEDFIPRDASKMTLEEINNTCRYIACNPGARNEPSEKCVTDCINKHISN